jgi:hypothetical protein
MRLIDWTVHIVAGLPEKKILFLWVLRVELC